MSNPDGTDESRLDGELAGLVYVPTPCPTCGATTEEQAGEICRPSSDQTGDYECPGEFKNGISVQPTPESMAAFNRAIDAMAAKDDEDERKREQRRRR